MSESINPIDKLFDEDNTDNIVLYGDDGVAVEFEQVALISLEDKDYAILALANTPDSDDDGEGIVFEIKEDEAGTVELATVTDDGIIDAVFAVYDRLWEEQAEK